MPAWPASSAASWPRAERPRCFEDGGQRRDFVHVRDVAAANVLALLGPVYDGALNVASGHPYTILDVARAVSAASKGPPPRVSGRFRLGDVRHIVASPARAEASIGFVAKTDPELGLQELAHAPLRRPPAPQLTARVAAARWAIKHRPLPPGRSAP